jgi:hypothetical protein
VFRLGLGLIFLVKVRVSVGVLELGIRVGTKGYG